MPIPQGTLYWYLDEEDGVVYDVVFTGPEDRIHAAARALGTTHIPYTSFALQNALSTEHEYKEQVFLALRKAGFYLEEQPKE